jgi:hypothetical protein
MEMNFRNLQLNLMGFIHNFQSSIQHRYIINQSFGVANPQLKALI